MKSSAFYAVIGIGVLLVAGIIWWGVSHPHKPPQSVSVVSTHVAPIAQVAAADVSSLSIFTNGPYGFSIIYPGSLPYQDTFATNSPMIVQIGNANENLQISAQDGSAAAGACANPKADESKQQPVTIQGVQWQEFMTAGSGATLAYRTVHDGSCIQMLETSTSTSDKVLEGIAHSFSFARS